MIADLKSYPSMKHSGTPWLGQVPEHWEAAAIRRFCRVFAGATPSRNVPAYWQGGSIPWLASGDVNLRRITYARQFITKAGFAASSTKWIGPGSLVIALAGQGRTKGMVATVEFSTTCNQSLAAIEPHPLRSDYRFLAYYLESRYIDIRALVGDDLRDGLNLEHVRGITAPLPPLSEQSAIVRFLEDADQRIQHYIHAKQKLIKLLEEQRQTIVHHAITRGLDSNISLKPSDLEWLGEVPEHWRILRTKSIFRLRTQKSGKAHGMELLSIYTHIGVRPRKDLEERGNKASTTDDYWIVLKGDLIVNKLLAWMGAVGISEYEGVTSPAYDILRPIQPLCPRYYHHLFRTKLYLQQFKQRSRGIMDMRLRLYFDQLGQIPVLVPPVAEQEAIVTYIAEATSDLEKTIETANREISLLREYRTRLIADVVTGKLDVRDAAANLPDIAIYDSLALGALGCGDVSGEEFSDLTGEADEV